MGPRASMETHAASLPSRSSRRTFPFDSISKTAAELTRSPSMYGLSATKAWFTRRTMASMSRSSAGRTGIAAIPFIVVMRRGSAERGHGPREPEDFPAGDRSDSVTHSAAKPLPRPLQNAVVFAKCSGATTFRNLRYFREVLHQRLFAAMTVLPFACTQEGCSRSAQAGRGQPARRWLCRSYSCF